jgi:SH3-like domain-containing protein
VTATGAGVSHRVVTGGASWWATPDPQRPPAGRLDPGLAVLVLEETTGWAHVRCENGFECWVDAGVLVPDAPTMPTPARPGATLAEPAAATDPEQVAAPSAVDATEARLVESPTRRAGPGRAATVSVWLSIAGAAIAIVGSFLAWFSQGGSDLTAWDIRLVALFTHEPTDLALKAGPVLLLAALSLAALVLRRPLPAWGALLLAAVPLVIGAAGVSFYLDLPGSSTSLGIGVIVTLAGAFVMLAGLLVSPRMLPRPLIRIA